MPRKLNIAPYTYRNKFYKLNGKIIKENNRHKYKRNNKTSKSKPFSVKVLAMR
jgi:hypothetical protein